MGKSKKNKNKNNNNRRGNQAPNIMVQSTQNGVPEDVKTGTDELEMNVALMQEKLQAESKPLDESEIKGPESEKPGELRQYLKRLQGLHSDIKGLLEKAEKNNNDTEQRNQKAKETEEELKAQKKALDDKMSVLNDKERTVLERELRIDNGEYTGTIRSLLDTFTKSAGEVSEETKKLITGLVEQQKSVLNKMKDAGEAEIKLLEERDIIEQEKKKIAREKRKMQIDMDIYKEETSAELREEYAEKYEEEKSKAERLSIRNSALEAELEGLKRLMMELSVTFGNREPQDILNEVARIRSENDELKEQLNVRPSLEEMDGLRKQIDLVKVENARLNNLVSEKEIINLRTIVNNTDSYVIEIQGYKDRLESSQNREDSLRRTIDDLKSTVDQLKGEHQKDEDAFQFARKYDSEYTLQNKGFKDFNPASLYDFANYMQKKIASSDKPFYYDIDTIRIFIAGLNMSNISILQGISGTGKTSLPREFAKAIVSEAIEYYGLGEDNTPKAPYRICAIQSGWRDNMDLMGYYNSFEHKYKETEFFKALYLANLPKYRDTLFFIILDEMNLSRPEHYFADFLSLLEQKEDERYITVNAPDEVLPEMIVQGKLRVPENVRFIGTANHDETTLEFAPKTYDRSNLMEMPKNQDRNIETTDETYNVSYDWIKEQFNNSLASNAKYYTKFKKFINSEGIRLLLMDKGIGIGNRFEDQAERFICAFIDTGSPKNREESLAKAADHLITTRLFRTLRNRYDLDKNSLQEFKKDFHDLFKKEFGFEPKWADEMLKSEIEKK